jgi:thiamine-phosphate diphosphorylase
MELHIISHEEQTPDELLALWPRLLPWADYFHLRFKRKSVQEVRRMAEILLDRPAIPPSRLIVNTHISLALELGCAGVHLPEFLKVEPVCRVRMDGLRIGRSVHSAAAAAKAEAEGADYVMAGHIFPSPSKPGLSPRGTGWLGEVVRKVKIPVIAVGGIGPNTVAAVKKAGARGVAVISLFRDTLEPERLAAELKRRWEHES